MSIIPRSEIRPWTTTPDSDRLACTTCLGLAVGAVGMAFVLGWLLASRFFGFSQPVILGLIPLAAYAGVVTKQLAGSLIVGLFLALVGTLGVMLRLSPDDEMWRPMMCGLLALSGIPCVLVAVSAGWFTDVARDSMNR